jgi:hypothetical protein
MVATRSPLPANSQSSTKGKHERGCEDLPWHHAHPGVRSWRSHHLPLSWEVSF